MNRRWILTELARMARVFCATFAASNALTSAAEWRTALLSSVVAAAESGYQGWLVLKPAPPLPPK